MANLGANQRASARAPWRLGSPEGVLEATTGFEPVIGVLQTPALPLGYVAASDVAREEGGAEDEGRTRDLLLGKEALYH